MARKTIEHRDFSGGDWGRLQPWNAPKNTFKATNMLVYRTGELGVRPGIRNVTPDNAVAGIVRDLLTGNQVSDRKKVAYVQGTQVFRFQPVAANTATASGGVFTASPTGFIYHYARGTNSYFATSNSGCYQLPSSNVLTALTGSPNARNIALYGDRLVVVESASDARIRYNGVTAGVSDFNTWPATNIIPVGDSSPIRALLPQRGHLVILKEYGGIYILTGQLGVNETLRQATFSPGPTFETDSAVTERDLVWFSKTDDFRPTNFDGTVAQAVEDVEFDTTSMSCCAFTTDGVEGVVFHGTPLGSAQTNILLYEHGKWSRHTMPIAFDQFSAASDQVFSDNPSALLSTAGVEEHLTSTFTFTAGGTASIAPTFYGWSPRLDRPGSEFGNFAQFYVPAPERAGDLSSAQVTGTLEFPEVHLQNSDEFMVREVVVDFRAWNTGGSLTNHFDLQVDCLRPYDNSSPITSLKNSWDEAGSLSSVSGTVKRQVNMFGDQGVGNGYQLKFTNIRGIAIQRIQVILETSRLEGS